MPVSICCSAPPFLSAPARLAWLAYGETHPKIVKDEDPTRQVAVRAMSGNGLGSEVAASAVSRQLPAFPQPRS